MKLPFTLLFVLMSCLCAGQLDSTSSDSSTVNIKAISIDLVDAEDHKVLSYVFLGAAGTFYYLANKQNIHQYKVFGGMCLGIGITVDVWSTLKRRKASKKLRYL